jgi:hypothetical protein
MFCFNNILLDLPVKSIGANFGFCTHRFVRLDKISDGGIYQVSTEHDSQPPSLFKRKRALINRRGLN